MNYRKLKASLKLHPLECVLLLGGAISATAGLVDFAITRNLEIVEDRKIQKIKQRTAAYAYQISDFDRKISNVSNRFFVQEDLKERNSPMRQFSQDAVIRIPLNTTEEETAKITAKNLLVRH